MDTCSRCDRQATDEIWCAKHYEDYLGEWACMCGDINEHDDKICPRCGQSPA